MPTSTGSRAARSSPSSASTICPEGAVVLLEWPDRAAGFLPPTGSTSRSRWRRSTGPSTATRASPATARFARARRAHRRHPPLPRQSGYGEAAARRRIQGDASTRILRAADARRPARHPDERAAPARRPAGARRQALQRDRASRRGRDAVRRHGERLARARLLGAGDLCRRPRRRPADHRGPRRRAGGGRRSAGADRGALRGGGRRAGRAAQPGAARTRCRSRRMSTIACRATTSTPS